MRQRQIAWHIETAYAYRSCSPCWQMYRSLRLILETEYHRGHELSTYVRGQNGRFWPCAQVGDPLSYHMRQAYAPTCTPCEHPTAVTATHPWPNIARPFEL
jgi:hypothetical protein